MSKRAAARRRRRAAREFGEARGARRAPRRRAWDAARSPRSGSRAALREAAPAHRRCRRPSAARPSRCGRSRGSGRAAGRAARRRALAGRCRSRRWRTPSRVERRALTTSTRLPSRTSAPTALMTVWVPPVPGSVWTASECPAVMRASTPSCSASASSSSVSEAGARSSGLATIGASRRIVRLSRSSW